LQAPLPERHRLWRAPMRDNFYRFRLVGRPHEEYYRICIL
jgi:hypothetical protein